eukprot:5272409-Amphidinium_carterae.1
MYLPVGAAAAGVSLWGLNLETSERFVATDRGVRTVRSIKWYADEKLRDDVGMVRTVCAVPWEMSKAPGRDESTQFDVPLFLNLVRPDVPRPSGPCGNNDSLLHTGM